MTGECSGRHSFGAKPLPGSTSQRRHGPRIDRRLLGSFAKSLSRRFAWARSPDSSPGVITHVALQTYPCEADHFDASKLILQKQHGTEIKQFPSGMSLFKRMHLLEFKTYQP